jgi:hypothetical protein
MVRMARLEGVAQDCFRPVFENATFNEGGGSPKRQIERLILNTSRRPYPPEPCDIYSCMKLRHALPCISSAGTQQAAYEGYMRRPRAGGSSVRAKDDAWMHNPLKENAAPNALVIRVRDNN